MKDMGKATVIKLPNGTVIELSPDMNPDQITALVNAVTVSGNVTVTSLLGEPIVNSTLDDRSSQEIWESSKKERVALFLRNYLSGDIWFTAKQIQELQLAETGSLALGETSAIATYLMRLHESGYLQRNKGSKGVQYKLTLQLIDEYPLLEKGQLAELIQLH